MLTHLFLLFPSALLCPVLPSSAVIFVSRDTITRMLTFVLDTSFMSAHNENQRCVVCFGWACMHVGAWFHYSVWNLQQNETSGYKDKKMRRCLELSWQKMLLEEQMCWQLLEQHFGTSEVSRAPWWSVSEFGEFDAKASRDTGNHTQFSKAKGRVQRSIAHGQAVWVVCEVNVHIHIMYRHHDHLHSWVSGFQKVLDSEDVWTSGSSIPLPLWAMERLELKQSCEWRTSSSKLAIRCTVFQHSVCFWNVCPALCGCLVERKGQWKMGTEDGGLSRP